MGRLGCAKSVAMVCHGWRKAWPWFATVAGKRGRLEAVFGFGGGGRRVLISHPSQRARRNGQPFSCGMDGVGSRVVSAPWIPMSQRRDMEHPAALKATADLSTSLRAAQDDRCLEGIVLSHPSSKKRSMDGAPGIRMPAPWIPMSQRRDMEHPAALKATADLSTSLRAAQDDRCLEGIVLSHPSSKKALDGWGTRHPRMFRLRFASLKMTDAWKGLCFPTHRAKSARWMGHLAPGTPALDSHVSNARHGAPGSPKSNRGSFDFASRRSR